MSRSEDTGLSRQSDFGDRQSLPAMVKRTSEMSDSVRTLNANDDPYAGQILDGAKAIAKYMVHLGFTEMTEKRVFHWAASGRLPAKKIGHRLISNKRSLLRHLGLD